MNILVLFGSKSDSYIYEPLKSRLIEDGHNVDFRLLSVHRSPDLLDSELSNSENDLIIAGAGLAAHLPGVLSSKVLTPIIGIPCTPALGGIDAMLSMIQMPFGIPVLTTAPDSFEDAVAFAKKFASIDLRFNPRPYHLVVEPNKRELPYIQEIVNRARHLATNAQIELNEEKQPATNSINICLVDILKTAANAPLAFPAEAEDEIRIYVPILNPNDYRDSNSAQLLLQRLKSANGLWVGLNNVGNALIAALALNNKENAHSAVLTNAKKGYIHV